MDTIVILIIVCICFFIIYNYYSYSIEPFYNYDDKQRIYTIMLKKISKIFNEDNVPFFLSSGTCLGYFRENKFIDYDYDIDIGVFYEDYNSIIITSLIENGFDLYRYKGKLETGCEFSFYYPNTILGKKAKLDLFIHYKDGDYVYWKAYNKRKKNMITYKVPKFDLKEVEFLGINVLVPNPTINYIENHYGKDWSVPKRPGIEYKFNTSPISIVN